MFKRLCTITAAALLTVASYAAAVEMREGHPSSYTVQRGDTLWDIAGRFLTKPWLWPEIWQANPQIENPHRIYPGDVISLAYLDGKPVLQVQTEQAGPRGSAESSISTIPLAEVGPFLRQSTIVSDLDDLPYVVSIEEERMRGVVGQVVYVRNLDSAKVGDTITIARPSHHFRLPAERQRNNVIPSSLDHRGDETYTDWRSFWATTISRDGESLGYELTTQGSARITQVQGEVAIALLVDGTAEVRAGDRVLPFESKPYDDSYLPQAPATVPETAAVLAVADASFAAGPRSVVALAVGSSDGVKNGTVFSTWRPGNAVVDDVAHSNFYRAQTDKVQLPDEFTGRVLVFRTFERVSYGLVMEGIRPVQVGDRLKHPDATQ